MLTFFCADQGNFLQMVVSDTVESLPKTLVWIDLLNPSQDEEIVIERLLGHEVPTRDDMQEIETSSRLHVDGDSLIMTLPILSKSSSTSPTSEVVTFILSDSHLVTIRYSDPMPFRSFIQRANRDPSVATSGELILIGLLETISDRLADIVEGATADLERLSHDVFQSGSAATGATDYKLILRDIGRVGNLASKAKDCLVNFMRLLSFLSVRGKGRRISEGRIATLNADAISIDQYAAFLSGKASFLLDATLGMINIEQNNVIKIFSVAAVAFLPPTLIASIYGMNFKYMPELEMHWGYPIAILFMIISAVLPLWHFRRKKWL